MRPLAEVEGPLLEALDVAQRFGFLGPKDIAGQLAHSVAFAMIIERLRPGVPDTGVDIVDLGSGGGIPGIVIASLLPSTRIRFVDSSQRRMAVLHEQLERLGLSDRGAIHCERAESFARTEVHRGSADIVVARGFAGPGITAECAAPILRRGGLLVVSDAPDETVDRWPSEGLARLGLVRQERVNEPFHFFVGQLVADCPGIYPRRIGIPEKRPLF